MVENKIILSDNRCYFIGDRVVFSQVMMFAFTGLITFILEAVSSEWVFVYIWWVFCLILPIIGIIWIAVKKEALYFNYSWKALFGLLALIWVSPTVCIGALIDDAFAGTFNAFWLGVFLALIYTAGYWLAKLFRVRRHSYKSTGDLALRMLIASVIIIGSTSVIGGLLYSSALQASGLGPFAFFEILSCQPCVMSVYIIISGIGIVAAMLLHYYMLACLFDPEGISVDEDPPNHCYLRMMIISLVLMFISWLLMLILFPPIPAGGGKGGKRGGVRATRVHVRRSIYASTRNYGKTDRYPADKVEEEWKEYKLGKDDNQN